MDCYELFDDVLFADGFDDALIGFGRNPENGEIIASYDEDKCIKILMDRDGMSAEEAEEFFDFNVLGSYVGKCTPIFISRIQNHKISEMRKFSEQGQETKA